MDTLTKILNASADLFRQYGFKTITMDDVARKAGVSKKTLYQHFANKNDVVNESVNWYKCRITEMCQNTMDDSENAIEAMVRVMGMYDQVHRQINPAAMLELERFYPEGFALFKESLLKQDVVAIRENIERGIEEGLYREDIDPEFMARYRMELSLMIFHPNFLVNDRFEFHFVAQQIAEHFLYGVMTAKGEKHYHKYKEKYLKGISRL